MEDKVVVNKSSEKIDNSCAAVQELIGIATRKNNSAP